MPLSSLVHRCRIFLSIERLDDLGETVCTFNNFMSFCISVYLFVVVIIIVFVVPFKTIKVLQRP